MIKNYLLIAWRIFKKNKFFNAVNTTGLGVAVAACFIITLYIEHENNYDAFHKNADKIYSVYSRLKLGLDTIEFPLMNYSTGSTVAANCPFIDNYVRIYKPFKEANIQSSIANVNFSESNFLFADSNFFNFFSFKLKSGNPRNVLQKPFSVVITQDAAKKYFGNTNPIGKLLKFDSAYTFQVTGVAENPPSNSIFIFDFIASLSSKLSMTGNEQIFSQQGISYGDFQTFFNLKNSADAKNLELIIRKLFSEQQDVSFKGVQYVIPLLKMHLHKKFGDSSKTKYLQILPLIAGLILLLALINYVSLSSAKAILRAKEIGIRKAIGAGRQRIIKQFFIESAVYISVSFILGFVIFIVIKHSVYNTLQFKIDNSYTFNTHVLLVFSGIFLFSIIFSAGYPAFVLSSYKPAMVLSGKFKVHKGITIRKLLTVFQFSIAIAVIIFSAVIYKQMYFIQHVNTGLDRSHILMIPFKTTLHGNYHPLKEDIRNLSPVKNIATARYPLYQKFVTMTVTDKKSGKDISLPTFTVDNQFISLLNLHWRLAPQDSSGFSKNEVVINETAIGKLNLNKNPVGQKIAIGGEEYVVKGVLKNFNYTSLASSIDALGIFVKADSLNNWGTQKDGCLYVKLYPNINIPQAIEAIQNIYKKYDKTTPFHFIFPDDSYEKMYEAENRLAFIIYVFTIIAISIALLGLVGLAAFSTEQKVKEIGIRKVLGASVKRIVYLLLKDFLKPILVAAAIGIPLAWHFTHKWLENFAYHTSVPVWIFIISAFIVITFTILSTASLSIKAALLNPVKNLRTE